MNLSRYDNAKLFIIFALYDMSFKIINYHNQIKHINRMAWNSLQKKHFNLFKRKIRWYLGISYFDYVYHSNFYNYQEPFIRNREWDIFFRDFGPMIENKAYLNSYLYKLDTVREVPLLWDIELVSLIEFKCSNIIEIIIETPEEGIERDVDILKDIFVNGMNKWMTRQLIAIIRVVRHKKKS